MLPNKALAFAVVGIAIILSSAVVISKKSAQSTLKKEISDNLSLPFEFERVTEPSALSFIGNRIDALVTITGDREKVLGSFEGRLRSKGAPVTRTLDSAGFQQGDIEIRLTHISMNTYRYEETFAL